MSLRVSVDALARTLGARLLRGSGTNLTLDIDSPEWLGDGPEHPLRLTTALDTAATPPAVWILGPRHTDMPTGEEPVLATELDIGALRYRASHYLDSRLPQLIPGTLVAAEGCGILIRGPAGVGKSEAALGLLDRGHELVADDAVTLQAGPHWQLQGHAPAASRGCLCVRGLGPCTVAAHYPGQCRESHRIDVIVTLQRGAEADPLRGGWTRAGLMGRAFTGLVIDPDRPTALLMELAAREVSRNRPSPGPVQGRHAKQSEGHGV